MSIDTWHRSQRALSSEPESELNPATSTTLCTLRLNCSNGAASSIGTGFLYLFKVPITEGDSERVTDIPMIVTNKHVVKNMTTLVTKVSMIPSSAQITDEAVSDADEHFTVTLTGLQESIAFHPDPNVDLCAVPAAVILQQIPGHLRIRHSFVTRDWHLTDQELSYTRPIEPVIMIGYPTGLWNEADNRPLSRRGLTASHPAQRWDGERKFLVDIACFSGSSGSPVFLFEDGMVRLGANRYGAGTRAKFVGILFAGPVINQQGRFEQRAIPTAIGTVPVIDGMMNLGYVVHADTVDDLIPVIRSRVEQEVRSNPPQAGNHLPSQNP